jgi:hypothetical protein
MFKSYTNFCVFLHVEARAYVCLSESSPTNKQQRQPWVKQERAAGEGRAEKKMMRSP